MSSLGRLLFTSLTNALYLVAEIISVVIYPVCRLLVRNRFRILCYHRVCDLPKTRDYVYRISVSPAAFNEQMAFLSQNGFNVITLDEFIERRDSGKKLEPKTVAITFDDGYGDNYLIAFPILRKYGFRATFFVTTDYIDSNNIFHWLKLGEELLSHSQEESQYWLPLTKQYILDMSNYGVSFGSHSKSHCNLTEVDLGLAEKEVSGSKEQLEKLLSRQVICFSYPYGKMSEQVKNLVKAAGYKAAVTVKGGSNTLESDFFQLRRTSIGRDDSFARFKRKVEGAYDWFEYSLQAAGLAKRFMFELWGQDNAKRIDVQAR